MKLHLNFGKKWFDMIKSGEKAEEYRNITPYWCNKFLLWHGERQNMEFWELTYFNGQNTFETIRYCFEKEIVTFREFDLIILSNGCSKFRPQINIFLEKIRIGTGKKEWGAVPDRVYFCLEIYRADDYYSKGSPQAKYFVEGNKSEVR